MDKQPTTPKSGALSRLFKATISAVLLAAFILLLSGHASQAGSATWRINPVSGDWNTATNWTAGGPPNGPADTATFQSSNVTDVSPSASTEVRGIVFNAGASAYKFAATAQFNLNISGVGITNHSGIQQNFVAAHEAYNGFFVAILFTNSATAGSLTAFTNEGATSVGESAGFTEFVATSTAGDGIFTNSAATVSNASGGETAFFDSSTAGNGTFTNNGATISGADAGRTEFYGTSTAGDGIFTNSAATVSNASGGETAFFDSSTAGNGTFINNGGLGGGAGGAIKLFSRSSGGTARVEVFGNGNLDISFNLTAGVTVGSIEGNGDVFLGGNTLIVGSNNRSTKFSGMIHDGGGRGGSLTKIGTGVLILDHRNTYTGGTTINGGKLVLNNKNGSGTGTGPVQVNRGRLGGRGTIAGDVTVGDGSGRGAALSPGNNAVTRGTLTIQSTLTFNSDATYNFWLNTSDVTADEVVALGVTINSGAQFSFGDVGGTVLPAGIVFTLIDNTAATPIAGTFRNLPDGSVFTSNGNTFQANYEGDDGNNLTLTVVP
jgi:autotransporter-associated beta strand protein